MSVRAVTPRLPALGGGLQFYRDADFFDVDQDARAVGDPYDPEWPDKPLRLSRRTDLVKGANAGRANGSVATRVMPAAPQSAGPDGRGSGSSLHEPSAQGGAGMSSGERLAAGPLDATSSSPAAVPPPPPPLRGSEPLQDVEPPRSDVRDGS